MGRSTTESLFLAGMLMVSSSAIIGKILQETGANHERSGQLAMGISVLEDVVAVVMLISDLVGADRRSRGRAACVRTGRDAAAPRSLCGIGRIERVVVCASGCSRR